MDFISIVRGIIGIFVIVGIAYLLSNNKSKVNWRLVVTGLGLQILFAILIIKGDTLENSSDIMISVFSFSQDFQTKVNFRKRFNLHFRLFYTSHPMTFL